MSKLLLSAALTAGFFITSRSAAAQSNETSPTPTITAVAAVPTPTDSTQAVQRLFRSRRTGAVLLAFPGGYAFGAGLARVQEGGISTMIIGGALAAVAINKGARFSKDKEAAMLTAYQQGKPLPAYVRKRVKKKHFRGITSAKAIKQRP